jgi:hypothetical protein
MLVVGQTAKLVDCAKTGNNGMPVAFRVSPPINLTIRS